MNIIDEIGILAISTRLQRLSEQLRKDGAQIYSYFNIDFEPKWFPVIYTLHVKEMLSVVEIASEIGYSHPSTISLLKELEKEKIISSKKDKQDERKRLIILTAKGKELVEKMQPVWSIMTKTLNEITNTQNNLLRAIEETEQNLTRQGFLQRAIELKDKD
ncbi:MarR family winged helix-turn-helix transcriptional regulator [Flavobacterium tistrianum]|uniref:MarR family winged helix-turn-helix transcriptional regulator n=1 Tax=Flavobacterium tistrianum TaxID=1685414 RepID=UPI000DAC9FCA|nr:MarR family transcriptional regulator [Flavobacterium tistrianum]KAF2338479.1 MarR family transcriptional regulator [Flavobacterium tistrianum]